ncbi:hypothetical protein Glove_208g135 [Diversispora epigaea]|uniref:Uncharacterized protein n=1 Tax=Diversispora epigaea TaxID=1348612 RepID=A0A397IJ44_9GLOM|nr:hypothetical protein Glove_208g135 [Diversispora epigaea]
MTSIIISAGDTGDTIIAVQENVINVGAIPVINVEEGAAPKLSPEELAIYNGLNDAEKVTFLKVLDQREKEAKEEGKKEERKRGAE